MNKQSEAWAGSFGDAYAKRSPGSVEENYEFFARALGKVCSLSSVFEFGAGVGNNLRALRKLLPNACLSGLEVNQKTAEHLESVCECVYAGSMLEYAAPAHDLAFTKGLLIHIPPADLPRAYEVLYQASKRYILIAEYYNPTPVMIPYRGQNDMLWKRDFASEMLDKYEDLRLIDYGFVYHRDQYPQDDVTWFLLEKAS